MKRQYAHGAERVFATMGIRALRSCALPLLSCIIIASVGGCRAHPTWDQRRLAFQMSLWQLLLHEELPENVVRDKNGNPTCSWRLACNFDINGGAWPRKVDVTIPWDADGFAYWREKAHEDFCILGDLTTNVMAVVGKGTAFERGVKCRRRALPRDLVVIIEVRDTGVHWMAPADLEIGQLKRILAGEGGKMSLGTTDEGFLVGFLDGEVWMLSSDIPQDVLLNFCLRESAAKCDREVLLAPYCLHRAGSAFGPVGAQRR